MTYLLDTNAFSDLMREERHVQARLDAASVRERVVTSTTVRGEVLFGISRLAAGRKRHDLETRSARFFVMIPCEPIQPAAADHYARIKLLSQQQGTPMGENDLWIAATALALGATLVTRDPDFRHVPGLTVEDWTI